MKRQSVEAAHDYSELTHPSLSWISLPLHLYSTSQLMAFPVRVAIAHILISIMTGLMKAKVDSTGTNSRDIETSKFHADTKRLPKLGSKQLVAEMPNSHMV